jgi:uncharacterized cupin superfamily protein
VGAPVDGGVGDFSHLDATWLARLAHDALERGNATTLATVKAEIARRPPSDRLACSREWIRQAPHRERARNDEARSAPEHWGFLASELRRLVSIGLDDRRGARDEGASRPACFDPLGLPEANGFPASESTGRPGQGWERWLSDHAGLTDLGVNLTRIMSGTQLSPRHPRHLRRDEFIYVVAGEVVLQTEAGEEVLRTGMCAGFPAGMRDGYAFLNRSEGDVLLLVVGDRTTLAPELGEPRVEARPGPDRRHCFAAGDDPLRA